MSIFPFLLPSAALRGRPFALSAVVLALVGCGAEDPPAPPAAQGPPPIVDENGIVPSVTCPGSPGCERADGPLFGGAAARTITPALEAWEDLDGSGDWQAGEPFTDENGNGQWDGVWLAGFAAGRAATAVHDDIWTRVITFEQGDVSFGMVALDLVGLFQQDAIRVRLRAKERGLDFDHILVATTHDHEAPDTMGMWGAEFGKTGYTREYIDFVIERTVDALAEAKAGQRVTRLKIARAEAPELVNDTRLPIVIDQTLHAAQLFDDEGAPFATLAVWGNHPEALGSKNTELTSDYPHYLREALEVRYPGATAVFFNGTLGGLTTPIGIVGCPDASGAEGCAQGTFERAAYVGGGAAEAAIAALEGPEAVSVEEPALGFRRRSFFVHATNTGLALLVATGVLPRDVYYKDGTPVPPDKVSSINISSVVDGEVVIGTEVNGLHVGPLAIATVPGEIYPELWLVKPDGTYYIEKPANADYPDAVPETPLQALLPAEVMPVIVNNANDALGYILPQAQFDELPPYAYDPEGQYGEQNSLGYMIGPTLTGEFAAMYGK